MSTSEEYFSSSSDGLKLFRQAWEPSNGKVRGVIVFAHGMLEHGGRHADWIGRIVDEQGYAVIAADSRGHGKSDGERAWVGKFEDFLDDYVQVLCDAAEKFPGKPLFAMGFSMGGAIATLTVLLKNAKIPELAGLILIAPAVRFRGKYFPFIYLSAALLDYLGPKVQVAKPNFEILSRDPNVATEMIADALVYKGGLLLHFGTEILWAMNQIQKFDSRLELPLLVMQGTSDWVVTPSGAEDLVRDASSRDKTLKIYDGLYHDLLHEPEQKRILADLVRWIEKEISSDDVSGPNEPSFPESKQSERKTRSIPG